MAKAAAASKAPELPIPKGSTTLAAETDLDPQASMIVATKVAIPARTSGQYRRSLFDVPRAPIGLFPRFANDSVGVSRHNSTRRYGEVLLRIWQRGVKTFQEI